MSSKSPPVARETTSTDLMSAGTEPESASRKSPRTNAATGASAASVRAVSAQLVAFYFRAPIKAFFRTRVEPLPERSTRIALKADGLFTPRLQAYLSMPSAPMAGASFQIK